MQETINPSRAAKQIGIPGSTLRLWAKTYAEFLSPGANPSPGEERRFTDADLEVLKAVNQLRHNGMLPVDIAQRLRNNLAAGQQDAPQSPVTALDVPAPANTPHDAIQAFLAHASVKLDDVADKVGDMGRRLESIEAKAESRRNIILIVLAIIAAFVLGVVTVVAVTWLLSPVR
jgi:DNA-binding transcriptional MerR regulator